MRGIICVLLLVLALGPLPPLLPAKPGPATRATYRATCSTRYYPTTYPRVCVRGWGLR